MIITKILQVTFSCLIANRAIKRVVQQQKFNYTCPGVLHFFTGNIFNFHAIHNRGTATCNQFGHWPRILFRTLKYFYEAGSAFAATTLQLAVKAHGRRGYLASNASGSL
jgi:hypothetical protein